MSTWSPQQRQHLRTPRKPSFCIAPKEATQFSPFTSAQHRLIPAMLSLKSKDAALWGLKGCQGLLYLGAQLVSHLLCKLLLQIAEQLAAGREHA